MPDGAKAHMAAAQVHILRLSRPGAVAHAVVRRAQVGAPFDHHLCRTCATAWRARGGLGAMRPEGAAGELPDIANHVAQTQSIGRIAAHRRQPGIPIKRSVLDREGAMPGVGRQRLFVRGHGLVARLSRSPLPLGLGGQFTARPTRIGLGIFQGDGHHRIGLAPPDMRAGSPRGLPPGAGHIVPPLVGVVLLANLCGRFEDQGARGHQGRRQAGVLARVEHALGTGFVAGGQHKGRELCIAHLGAVHPETVDLHRLLVALLGIDRVAWGVAPTGDPHHAVRRC